MKQAAARDQRLEQQGLAGPVLGSPHPSLECPIGRAVLRGSPGWADRAAQEPEGPGLAGVPRQGGRVPLCWGEPDECLMLSLQPPRRTSTTAVLSPRRPGGWASATPVRVQLPHSALEGKGRKGWLPDQRPLSLCSKRPPPPRQPTAPWPQALSPQDCDISPFAPALLVAPQRTSPPLRHVRASGQAKAAAPNGTGHGAITDTRPRPQLRAIWALQNLGSKAGLCWLEGLALSWGRLQGALRATARSIGPPHQAPKHREPSVPRQVCARAPHSPGPRAHHSTAARGSPPPRTRAGPHSRLVTSGGAKPSLMKTLVGLATFSCTESEVFFSAATASSCVTSSRQTLFT